MAGFEFLLKKKYTGKNGRGSWIAGSMVMYRSLLATDFAYNIDEVLTIEKQVVANNPKYREDRVKLGLLIADIIDGLVKIPEPTVPKTPRSTTKKPTRGTPTKTAKQPPTDANQTK